MVEIITIDEARAIDRKQGRMLLIGGGMIAFDLAASIGLAISGNADWYLMVMAGIVFLVGASIMLSAPFVYECQRCGEYYTRWWRHPEDVCLCNLKTKLSKLECK